jgi:uncharacterized membrane protein
MRKFPKGVKGVELTISIVFTVLLACIIIAPFTLKAGSVTDLSGKVGSIDNSRQISQFNVFAQAIYYFGDVNCHQIADRSYYLNGNEMPICSRDLGIMFGLPLTLFALAFTGFKPRFWMVVLLAVPMAADGGMQAVSHYSSFNELRLLTGLFAGAAAASFLAILALLAMTPEDSVQK